jgi:hypothetical protein
MTVAAANRQSARAFGNYRDQADKSLPGAQGTPRLSDSESWRCPITDPSAGPSPSPPVKGLAVLLGCVIVAISRLQIRMNARREAL